MSTILLIGRMPTAKRWVLSHSGDSSTLTSKRTRAVYLLQSCEFRTCPEFISGMSILIKSLV